jgi:hypothetical protein
MRNFLPLLQICSQEGLIRNLIISDIRYDERETLQVVCAAFIVGHHDERVVDISVNPVPYTFGILEALVILELEHHVLAAVYGFKMAGETFHSNNGLILLREIDG